MNIIVTGGCGYIGSHVVDALRTEGHDVASLDIRDAATGEGYHNVDIRDVKGMVAVMKDVDVVFHVAGIANARQALDDPVTAIDVNIRGTGCVLEAARQAGVKRVIFASTVWFYNGTDRTAPDDGSTLLLDESAPILPAGAGHVYTTSKIASELLCHDFHQLYGQEFTILRYGIPYGPRMWPGLALRAFLDRVFAGDPIRIFGDGSAVRRFVYVEDMARAHVLALSDKARNQTYNLEGERDVTIKELAETVQRHLGETKIEYVIDPNRRGELVMNNLVISNEKAHRDLGWAPQTSLDDGVSRTIEWYRSEVARQS